MCLSYKIILFTSHSLWYFEDKVDIWAWRKRMNRLTNLLGHPLPVAQKGNKVLTVAPQQVIRHFLADEDLGSLDDFADGQRRVVVVILVVNTVRITAHHLLQQLHANHSLPAEDGLYAGHSGCRAFIWRKEEQPCNRTVFMLNYKQIKISLQERSLYKYSKLVQQFTSAHQFV